jgi:CBS domain containing-hemolysin-like protein
MILLFIALTLLLSAFFSGSEIAFVAANRLRVEVSARRGGRTGALVSKFLEDPAALLTTTLVGNNLALVVYSSLAAFWLEGPLTRSFSTFMVPDSAGLEVAVLGAQTAIAAVVVLLFGEIIPKSFMREFANRSVFVLAVPLRVCYFVLLPLISLARWSAAGLMRFMKTDSESLSQFMRRDFELMIEESKRAGDLDLDEEESTLLSNVFAMGSVRVKESMVPRTDLIAVEERVTIAELQATFVKSGHSKLPVYRDNIDNIVGIVFAYDLFDKPQQLDDILRSVNFVPETKMSKDLLREFLATGTSIAIVIDEYGGTAGLVTTEDLLEELFGDIQDEFDHEDHVLRVVDDRTVIASGRVDIDELRERTPIQLSDEGDYETIAGFILARLGTIPARRDEFELDGYRFQVLAASTNRVDMVRITRASELIQEEKKNGR